MKITVHGAAGGEVTGSCYLVQTRSARVFVDCGLFQGGREAEARNRPPGGIRCSEADAVVLTHAHLDHTGRLPLLTRQGFTGPIHATPATEELTGLILRDAAKLQVQEAERRNRKLTRAGEEPIEPLYTPENVEATLRQLVPAPYHDPVEVAPGIRATWFEAGHMLGSSCIQLEVEEDGTTRRIVFSGDLGPRGAPILRDFETLPQADLVFLESTYGGRDHRPFRETVDEFVTIVRQAVEARGKILVPTFAVGRAQTLMLLLGWMFRTRKVKPFPVFLDSPMAIEASNIYARHVELFDDEMRAYLREGQLRDDLKSLQLTATAEESRRINDQPGPCLILAGAGMCNAGRILHHLKHNLWNAGTHVMIVGYQSQGSLGRRLVEGEPRVRIHGDIVAVRAQVHTLGGFSAHAGQTDLLAWFASLAPARPRVVLTHGEDDARAALASKIQSLHGLKCVLPALGETLTL